MTYNITPERFAFTPRLKWLIAFGSLPFLMLPAIVPSLINTIHATSWLDFVPGLIIWLVGAIWWPARYTYRLEVDDNTVRARGRVVRKGHVRYLREIDARLLGGPQLVLSEHGPLWVHFFGDAIVIPMSMPKYEEIKKTVSTWMPDSQA
jgi:hypothetical protein